MRIVDVCAFYTPSGGGVRTYIDRKFAAAQALGQEVVVIAPGSHHSVTEIAAGAILVTVPGPVLPVDRRYRYFSDETALHHALDQWRPDFVEASSPWASAGMVARWSGPAHRSLVMHADPLSAYAYRWLGRVASIDAIDRRFEQFWRHLRRLDDGFDMVVCASADLANRLRRGGLRNVATIPMGVEPGLFSPGLRDPALRREMLAECGLDEDAVLMLGVGRYSAEKRWGLVIDAALAAGATAKVGLLLLGDGRARPNLISRASGSPHIVVGGPVRDRARLAAIMASADALVHGCEAETFCMSVAEARASGLPVIVPDRGGAADHAVGIQDRRYRATDAGSLRDAMLGTPARRGPGVVATHYPRLMDEHFAELFAAYAAVRTPLAQAA